MVVTQTEQKSNKEKKLDASLFQPKILSNLLRSNWKYQSHEKYGDPVADDFMPIDIHAVHFIHHKKVVQIHKLACSAFQASNKLYCVSL